MSVAASATGGNLAAAWAGMGVLSVDVMIALSAITLLLGDVVLPHGNKRLLGWTALVQLVLCLVATFFLDLHGSALSGAYVGGPVAVMLKRIFLFSAIVVVLAGIPSVERDTPRRQGEYYQLILFSVLGMSLLAGTRDLILLLVAFELMSLPLYALVAFARTGPYPHRPGPLPGLLVPATEKWLRPAEAGLKLFVVGAVSSAIAAYGISLLYGATGTTRFVMIAQAPSSPLLTLGACFALAGVCFKIGAAPFHMWVPDAYQGARTSLVAFLAVAPKAAGLTVLVQLLLGPLAAHSAAWAPLLVGLIVVSVAVGNLMAVPQQNVKRMLAFSGVAHIGFALMGVLATGVTTSQGSRGEGLATLLFFLCAYLVANTGIFLVVEAISSDRTPDGEVPAEVEQDDTLATFAGLARRSPWLGLCALIFVLSLGGIPFAVGFWAKLYVLLAVWQAGFAWLVLLAAVLSAAGLFYYLQVVRALYMREPTDAASVRTAWPLRVAIILCAALTIGVGLYPAPFIAAARAASAAFVGG